MVRGMLAHFLNFLGVAYVTNASFCGEAYCSGCHQTPIQDDLTERYSDYPQGTVNMANDALSASMAYVASELFRRDDRDHTRLRGFLKVGVGNLIDECFKFASNRTSLGLEFTKVGGKHSGSYIELQTHVDAFKKMFIKLIVESESSGKPLLECLFKLIQSVEHESHTGKL